MARLEQTKIKLRKNPALQKEYQEAIQKYEAEGTSEEYPFEETTSKHDRPIYYVPVDAKCTFWLILEILRPTTHKKP